MHLLLDYMLIYHSNLIKKSMYHNINWLRSYFWCTFYAPSTYFQQSKFVRMQHPRINKTDFGSDFTRTCRSIFLLPPILAYNYRSFITESTNRASNFTLPVRTLEFTIQIYRLNQCMINKKKRFRIESRINNICNKNILTFPYLILGIFLLLKNK